MFRGEVRMEASPPPIVFPKTAAGFEEFQLAAAAANWAEFAVTKAVCSAVRSAGSENGATREANGSSCPPEDGSVRTLAEKEKERRSKTEIERMSFRLI